MNREELTEAIHDLADSPHMRQHALEHAMAALDLNQLAELFDQVADHHAMLHPAPRRRVPRNPQLDDRSIKPVGVDTMRGGGGRRLCAHAHFDGRGAHWLDPGEVCPFAQF
jgi:hypothetical protein